MVPSRRSPEPRAESLLERLRERVRETDANGERRLPPERELARELDVGRRSVRDALARLEAEGIIWRKRGVGTVITAGPSRRSAPISVDDIRRHTSPGELMDSRLVLEPGIAALAALNATSADLENLHRCLARTKTVTDHQAWEKWDGALHQAIGQASHNGLIERLYDLLNVARSHTEWGRLRKSSLTPQLQATYTRQHEAVIKAITDRDPEQAAVSMREHLTTVRNTLFKQWDWGAGGDVGAR
ncbi:GntR family transcriptional regulator [Spiribacter halobius]|uniref:GntR family transcriptional regulator n=1 Tax=Sediminicurvatus halobius TaxID=2182432 RepID=A0A2U2MWX3_9GAMM|nr:GntR family transcriptional regulator [Spiribacter halobius]UEX76576.1 FadR family transcriptional regulator [Spiribacter halobius]